MKYTTEEIKTIKGHIKAIENYCKRVNACREAFRQYIFNTDGNYLIGGQTVSEFITEADKLLYGRSF